MNDREIENIVKSVASSMRMEGFEPNEISDQYSRDILSGAKTVEQVIADIEKRERLASTPRQKTNRFEVGR